MLYSCDHKELVKQNKTRKGNVGKVRQDKVKQGEVRQGRLR
jgi:hypothetical protein